MVNKSHDWLGICLDMMSEYLPVEVTTIAESRRYWEINEHHISVLELAGLTRRPGTSQRADYINDFLKDFMRIFSMKMAEPAMSESDGENNFDNAALNNLLLFGLMVNSQELETHKKVRGSNIEN